MSFVVRDSTHNIHTTNFGWESWEMGWTARSIFLGKGFSSPFLPITGPTALVPPLYPYVIAVAFRCFGLYTTKAAIAILGFNSVCSALTCLPLYVLVRNMLSDRLGRLAALAWAVYPFAVYFSADRVWDYALTGLLFTSCLAVGQQLPSRGRGAWFGFGALYGLTVMSNPSVATFFPVMLLFALYQGRHALWRCMPSAALAVVAFVLVCTPWQVRNYRVMHANFFIRDGFALEAYAGNNGDTHESNSAFAHPASNPAEMAKYERMGEIAYMQQKRVLVLDFARHHPMFVAVATVRRIVRFWTGFWSFAPSYLKYEPFDAPNIPFCLALLFFTVRGVRLLWRTHRSAAIGLLSLLAIFPLPYYITHASPDYRQPIEPEIIAIVIVGIFGLQPKVWRRKRAISGSNELPYAGHNGFSAEVPAMQLSGSPLTD